MNKPYKRRNYFIKKNFQGKYVLIYFSLVIVGSIIFSLLFSLISANTLSISYDNYNLRVGATPHILFDKFFTAEWLFILLGGLAVVVFAILLSHRVAGPFFKLERSINGMISGNLASAITLRKKDEGKEIATKLNQFNATLSAKLQEMRHLNKSMESYLNQLHEKTESQQENDSFKIILQEMTEVNGQLRELLYGFTIVEE